MTNYEQLNKNLELLELKKIKEELLDYTHEIAYKNTRAKEEIIKLANFPFRKTLDDYDFAFQSSVT